MRGVYQALISFWGSSVEPGWSACSQSVDPTSGRFLEENLQLFTQSVALWGALISDQIPTIPQAPACRVEHCKIDLFF